MLQVLNRSKAGIGIGTFFGSSFYHAIETRSFSILGRWRAKSAALQFQHGNISFGVADDRENEAVRTRSGRC
jgi:hypothetical protein